MIYCPFPRCPDGAQRTERATRSSRVMQDMTGLALPGLRARPLTQTIPSLPLSVTLV